MNKKNKQVNKKLFSIFGVGILVLVVLFGGFLTLQGAKADVSFKELLAEKIANSFGDNILEMLGLNEFNLGGTNYNRLIDFSEGISVDGTTVIDGDGNWDGAVTASTGTFSGTLSVAGVLTLDGNITLTDGSNQTEYFYEVVDFTSTGTSTLALFDPNSEGYDDFYLVDLWIENSEKATSTTRIAVTTSTATVIASDNYSILSEDASGTLLDGLGNAFGADGAAWNGATATSSEFYLRQYPGTDTRLAAGTNPYPILIPSTTNIMVFSTSTEDGPVYLEGKLHIVGKESNR